MYFLQRELNDITHTMNVIRLSGAFFCLAFLLFSQPLCAEDESVEYKIKAGYLYNFTKFISWPEDSYQTFNLCILGDDPFGNLIDPIEQRRVSDRPIKLVRLSSSHSFSGDKPLYCHILFVSASVTNTPTLQGKTLTVGESPNFAQRGGIIGFINRDGRIKLQINLAAVKQSGLKISAKLLEVADIIDGGKQ